MADYSQAIDDLRVAAEICEKHVINDSYKATYPRWPNAWAACEVVWRYYLETKTMDAIDEEDRQAVMREAYKLR